MLARMFVRRIGVKLQYGNREVFFFGTSIANKKKMYHPTVQRILQGDDITHTSEVLKQVGGLSDSNREIALKLILKNIFIQKLPLQTIESQLFLRQAHKNPEILIDSYLYLIKIELHKLNSVLAGDGGRKEGVEGLNQHFSKINGWFNTCTQAFRKLQKDKNMRSGIIIRKRLADYYLNYLTPLYPQEEKMLMLTKSCQNYRQAILVTAELISQERIKIKLKEQEPQSEDKAEQQERDFVVNSLKESIRILVETNAQNVASLFKAINQIHKIKRSHQNLVDGLTQSLSNIERAINLFKVLQDLKLHSIFYHRLRKMKVDIGRHLKYVLKKGEQKDVDEEYSKQLEEVYKEADGDLQKVGTNKNLIANSSAIAVIMFNTRIQLLKREKMEEQIFELKLYEQIKSILSKIEDKEIRKAIATKLASTMQIYTKTTKRLREEQIFKSRGQ